MCVQRHTSNIVIEDAGRARAADVARHRRRARRAGARRRLPVSVLSPRRPAAAQELGGVSGRAASLCAPLLAGSPALCSVVPERRSGDGGLAEDMNVCISPEPSTSAMPEAAFVPGTPGMETEYPAAVQADVDEAGCVGELSAMCISRVCSASDARADAEGVGAMGTDVSLLSGAVGCG